MYAALSAGLPGRERFLILISVEGRMGVKQDSFLYMRKVDLLVKNLYRPAAAARSRRITSASIRAPPGDR